MLFMEIIRICVVVKLWFLLHFIIIFQQGNDTHTFLHIIDNI